MDSDSKSEPLDDVQDKDEDVLAGGDDSDILDVRAEAEDVSCRITGENDATKLIFGRNLSCLM